MSKVSKGFKLPPPNEKLTCAEVQQHLEEYWTAVEKMDRNFFARINRHLNEPPGCEVCRKKLCKIQDSQAAALS